MMSCHVENIQAVSPINMLRKNKIFVGLRMLQLVIHISSRKKGQGFEKLFVNNKKAKM